MMHLFDSHCHMDDPAFDADREELLCSLPSKGVENILWCGTNLASCRTALAYAESFDYIYCACGFYPHETAEMDGDALAALTEMLNHPKCAAVGEIGLDYHYDGVPRKAQLEALRRQLDMAARADKPVILHERDALPDMLSLLRERGTTKGVVHCFSGSRETAREYLDLGLYISFTGLITFKSARLAPEAAAYAPRDRVLIETDSPYMTPVPFRGERNDPSRVAIVNARLAELWQLSQEETAVITRDNARRLFGIE